MLHGLRKKKSEKMKKESLRLTEKKRKQRGLKKNETKIMKN